MSPSWLVRPFAALRPGPGHAAAVAAPPYDVMTAAEARAMAAGRPLSFLHVSRAEIDLPEGTDPYDDAVYARAAANLAALEADGVLLREARPCYYAYRIANATHSQLGVALAASVAAYDAGRIRRHELTRPAKETDRVRQIEAVGAITGPVMLAHRGDERLAAVLAAQSAGAPLLAASLDGWQHEVWAIDAPDAVAAVTDCFEAMEALYIADGHHRSAAASRVGADRGATDLGFLAVSFAADDLEILDYNRVVRDLNGLEPDAFLERLGVAFDIAPAPGPVRPDAPLVYGLYLDGAWRRLTLRAREAVLGGDDPVARLDVEVLDRELIRPVLGITDPRTDPRIDFVGGSRGVAAVAERVDGGDMRVGFTLHPTAMADLMAVAAAGRIMPPKSTWFDPKLADGLLSLPLD